MSVEDEAAHWFAVLRRGVMTLQERSQYETWIANRANRAALADMPLTSKMPSVGCSRSAMARSSVVLPQPDGPISETNSPGAMARSTSRSACTGESAGG